MLKLAAISLLSTFRWSMRPGQFDLLALWIVLSLLLSGSLFFTNVFLGVEENLRRTLLDGVPESGRALRVQLRSDPELNAFPPDVAHNFQVSGLEGASISLIKQIDGESGQVGLPFFNPSTRTLPMRARSADMSGISAASTDACINLQEVLADGTTEVDPVPSGGRQNLARFDGLALAPDDPLWREAVRQSGAVAPTDATLPFFVILSREAISALDVPKYMSAMLPTLTAPEARAFGQTVCLADLIDAPAFHMRVSGVGRDGEQMMIVEVPAFWVDSLPGPDQVGFFFPIATEAALRRLPFGCFAPGFDPGTEGIDEGVYFPKAQGQSSTRIAEIELLGVAQSLGQEETDTYAKALSACLGPMPMPGASEGIGAKGDGWLTHLRSEDQLAQCEAISGVIPEIRRHQFVTKRDSLAWHVTAEGKVEPLDKTVPLPSCMRSGSDSIPVFADLRHAMIYLPEGIDIISARDIILGYKWPFEFSRPTATDPNAAVLSEKNIFDFAPSYERAIARFAYLEELASHLRLPLGLALGVLAMLLVVILLFGTINNRRTEFGWLMAEGRSMRFVRGFFMAQLCVVLALVVPTGLAFYWFAADVLNVHFERSQAVDLAEKQLGQVDLFVIDPSSSTMIWPVVMTFVLTVIALPMIFGPLRLIFQSKHRQSPIRLISS